MACSPTYSLNMIAPSKGPEIPTTKTKTYSYFLYTPTNGRRQHHSQIPTPHLKNYNFINLPKTPPVSIVVVVLLYVICCLYMNFSEVLTSAPHSYFFVYVLNISKYSYTYLYFGHNRVKILPDGEAFSPTNYPYTTHPNSFEISAPQCYFFLYFSNMYISIKFGKGKRTN